MPVSDELVLKLAPTRVAALIEARVARSNVVGGHAMKEWANLSPENEKEWLALARESLDYVRNKK